MGGGSDAPRGRPNPLPAAARPRRGPAGNEGAGRVPHPPAADKRRAACIRLAVLLGLVAFAFYLGMFMMGGT